MQLLLGADGWVSHVENSVRFELDVTKTMFSSGNGSERMRMAQTARFVSVHILPFLLSVTAVGRRGETVVDLYSGIGYFSVPALVHAGVERVFACEWNQHTLEGLRRTVAANNIDESRIHIFPGDNAKAGIEGVADRVFLGLIPTSEKGWPVAIRALKSTGGTLHLHGNARDGREREWAERVLDSLQELVAQQDDEQKRTWKVCAIPI